MQITRLIAGALLLALWSLSSHAQVESEKGTAMVTYKRQATADIKAQALHDAQVNAIERYMAEMGASQTENFAVIRSKVSTAVASYILGTSVLSEEDKTDTHQYSVVVRVDLNVARLRNEFKTSSNVANTAEQRKSPLTFVFVARAKDSEKSFDVHTYRRADTTRSTVGSREDSKSGTEGENVRTTEVSTSADSSAHLASQSSTTDIAETGGSTLRRADQATWVVIPSENLSAIVTGVFSSAGFDVVEAEYVEPQSNGLLSVRALQSDYRTGNDLQPQTLRNTVQGLRAAQVPYLALATLDVDLPGTDPATGLVRVYVTVTGKVLDVSGHFPKNLASVGPEQFAGTGPSSDVAQTNALKLAADKSARELLSRINVVGIH